MLSKARHGERERVCVYVYVCRLRKSCEEKGEGGWGGFKKKKKKTAMCSIR